MKRINFKRMAKRERHCQQGIGLTMDPIFWVYWAYVHPRAEEFDAGSDIQYTSIIIQFCWMFLCSHQRSCGRPRTHLALGFSQRAKHAGRAVQKPQLE